MNFLEFRRRFATEREENIEQQENYCLSSVILPLMERPGEEPPLRARSLYIWFLRDCRSLSLFLSVGVL